TGLDVENLVVADVVAHVLPQELAPVPAKAESATQVSLLERRVARPVGLRAVGVDAGGQVLVEEIGLREAEVQLRARARDHKVQTQILPATEQVALAHAHVSNRAVRRREAGAERELACGLLFDVDFDDGPVRCAALHRLEVDLAEEAEILDPLARPPDLGRIEGVALDNAELAADHFIEGT